MSQGGEATFGGQQRSTRVDIIARPQFNAVQNRHFLHQNAPIFFEVKMGREEYLLAQVTGKEHLQKQLAAGPLNGVKHFVLCSSDLKGEQEQEIRGALDKSQMLVVLPKKEIFDMKLQEAITRIQGAAALP